MRQRPKAIVKYLLYLAVVCGVLLLAIEGGLRLFFGLPRGLFYFRPMDNSALYRPNVTIDLVFGPIPYRVRINSLGFRGPALTREKPAGVTRIIALGDSVTDGFYVENENTYPYQLEQGLRALGVNAEVVNAARGNTSLDREIEIYKKFCAGLDPDIVVLLFVSNDIDQIRGVPKENLINLQTIENEPAAASEMLLFGRTAIGELILDASMARNYRNYHPNQRLLDGHTPDSRYDIAGNIDFAENTRKYYEWHVARTDGVIGHREFTEIDRQALDGYEFALAYFGDLLNEQGVQLILAYYPEYNQVYELDPPMILRDAVRDICARLDVTFIDLTDRFRSEGANRALHLAPVDYHPNPDGNRVIAEGIGEELMKMRTIRVP